MFDPRVRLHSVGRENHEVARLMFALYGRLSAVGTKRTSLFASHMPALGGKADIPFCSAYVRL